MITATNATTFTAAVQHGLTRAPIVTLGGQDAGKFAPNINMGFSFKGEREERFINLNRIDKAASTSIEKCTGGIIVDKTDQYLIDAAGNLKWNIILAEKPKSPRIRLKVDFSDGTEFHPQGTLEDDWKTDPEGLTLDDYLARHERPIDIIDSLAVYIDKSNNEYRTGKVAHWHRIIMYDKAGNVGFGRYERVDKNQIDIVLDEKYLEAVEAANLWPVLVDPSFGTTSIGGSTYSGYTSINCSKASSTPASNGTLTGITMYCKSTSSNLSAALYSDSSGVPSALLAGDDTGVAIGTDWDWITCPLSYGSITTGTQYWLAHKRTSTYGVYYAYDTGDTGEFKRYTLEAFPATLGSSIGGTTNRVSIYATYTASGGTADLTASASTITKAESDVTLFLGMSASAIASISAASGDMDLALALTGLAANTSAAVATLQQYMALSGQSDTKSSASSDVDLQLAISGLASSISAAVAFMGNELSLTGTAASETGATSDIDLYLNLVALSDSISASVGSLSVSGSESITGTIETISAALGALSLLAQSIAGTVTGEIGQQFIKGAIGEQKITGEIGEQFIKGSIN